jgi:hypothetical protein
MQGDLKIWAPRHTTINSQLIALTCAPHLLYNQACTEWPQQVLARHLSTTARSQPAKFVHNSTAQPKLRRLGRVDSTPP